ncbi:hypothetical protein G9A89_006076 [Geosiphon pyriformis]|nr:hypothetical protein G9A89_006076 [Geosiphon pyriformis]
MTTWFAPSIKNNGSYSPEQNENQSNLRIRTFSPYNSHGQPHGFFIKVDLYKIIFMPNGHSQASDKYSKIALLFRYITNEISLTFNSMKYEIIIPLTEVTSFEIRAQEIQVGLCSNFQKTIYHHPNGHSSRGYEEISFDPTLGEISIADTLIMTSMNWVERNTLLMIEAGIENFSPRLVSGQTIRDDSRSQDLTRESSHSSSVASSSRLSSPSQSDTLFASLAHHSNNEDGENDDFCPTEADQDQLILITCTFLIERRQILFPRKDTFEAFKAKIRDRFHINPNKMASLNGAGETILLIDKDDWDVAIWEANMQGRRRIEISRCKYFYKFSIHYHRETLGINDWKQVTQHPDVIKLGKTHAKTTGEREQRNHVGVSISVLNREPPHMITNIFDEINGKRNEESSSQATDRHDDLTAPTNLKPNKSRKYIRSTISSSNESSSHKSENSHIACKISDPKPAPPNSFEISRLNPVNHKMVESFKEKLCA